MPTYNDPPTSVTGYYGRYDLPPYTPPPTPPYPPIHICNEGCRPWNCPNFVSEDSPCYSHSHTDDCRPWNCSCWYSWDGTYYVPQDLPIISDPYGNPDDYQGYV
jgi:hypothetical protein